MPKIPNILWSPLLSYKPNPVPYAEYDINRVLGERKYRITYFSFYWIWLLFDFGDPVNELSVVRAARPWNS